MYNNRTKVKLKNAFYDLNLMIYIYLVHTHTLYPMNILCAWRGWLLVGESD